MSVAVSDSRSARGGAVASGPRARRRGAVPSMAFDAIFDLTADGRTLDDIVAGAWEDLSAHRTVACPVCHAVAMRPRYGAGQGPVGGHCGGCGSVLG